MPTEAIQKERVAQQRKDKNPQVDVAVDPELYLRDLEIRTKNLRKHALTYSFKDCKVEEETLFPWPLI
jgi:hypothetical protein